MATSDAIFLLLIEIVVPLFCIALGCWVALARPFDPNAWFILFLLTYPAVYILIGTYNWIPEWLGFRLVLHLITTAMAPAPCCFWGRFSRSEHAWTGACRGSNGSFWLRSRRSLASVLADYAYWYPSALVSNPKAIDRVVDPVLNWIAIDCVALYWFLLVDKLRTAFSFAAVQVIVRRQARKLAQITAGRRLL